MSLDPKFTITPDTIVIPMKYSTMNFPTVGNQPMACGFVELDMGAYEPIDPALPIVARPLFNGVTSDADAMKIVSAVQVVSPFGPAWTMESFNPTNTYIYEGVSFRNTYSPYNVKTDSECFDFLYKYSSTGRLVISGDICNPYNNDAGIEINSQLFSNRIIKIFASASKEYSDIPLYAEMDLCIFNAKLKTSVFTDIHGDHPDFGIPIISDYINGIFASWVDLDLTKYKPKNATLPMVVRAFPKDPSKFSANVSYNENYFLVTCDGSVIGMENAGYGKTDLINGVRYTAVKEIDLAAYGMTSDEAIRYIKETKLNVQNNSVSVLANSNDEGLQIRPDYTSQDIKISLACKIDNSVIDMANTRFSEMVLYFYNAEKVLDNLVVTPPVVPPVVPPIVPIPIPIVVPPRPTVISFTR